MNRTICVDEDNEVPLVWCVITVIAEGDYEQGRSFYRKLSHNNITVRRLAYLRVVQATGRGDSVTWAATDCVAALAALSPRRVAGTTLENARRLIVTSQKYATQLKWHL